jgi:hypothetical protein
MTKIRPLPEGSKCNICGKILKHLEVGNHMLFHGGEISVTTPEGKTVYVRPVFWQGFKP